jgi:hypothetical protein
MHKECVPQEGWKVIRELKALLKRYDAILAGGTALALQIGHRVSLDLDFFTCRAMTVETIIAAMRRSARSFRIMSEGHDHITASVEGVKLSLFRYEYPFLEKTRRLEGLHIAGILDIAAMKLIAISQRGTKRDFIDLYFIMQGVPFHRIAAHSVHRFGKERISPVHIGKSLVYFTDAESHPDPAFLKGREVEWATVKKFFRQHVKQMVLDLHTAVEKDD